MFAILKKFELDDKFGNLEALMILFCNKIFPGKPRHETQFPEFYFNGNKKWTFNVPHPSFQGRK